MVWENYEKEVERRKRRKPKPTGTGKRNMADEEDWMDRELWKKKTVKLFLWAEDIFGYTEKYH